jgi:hypothetical protein
MPKVCKIIHGCIKWVIPEEEIPKHAGPTDKSSKNSHIDKIKVAILEML